MVLLRGWGLGSGPGSGTSACSPSTLGLSLCLQNPSASCPPSLRGQRGAKVTLGQTPPCPHSACVDTDSGICWLSREVGQSNEERGREKNQVTCSPGTPVCRPTPPAPRHLFRPYAGQSPYILTWAFDHGGEVVTPFPQGQRDAPIGTKNFGTLASMSPCLLLRAAGGGGYIPCLL